MLKDIIDLVKQKAAEHYEKHTDVPNEHAEETAKATGESIFEALKTNVLEGDFKGVKDVLSGVNKDDLKDLPIVKNIIEITSKKMQENGVDKETADIAAEGAVPGAVEQVSEKYASDKDEDANFDLKGLIEKVSQEEGRGELLEAAKEKLSGMGIDLGDWGDKVGDQLEDLSEKLGDQLGDVGEKLEDIGGKIGSALGGLFGKRK
ncbi:MAG: hypothetical protein ACPG49_13465 [Chitinophagales bacterium]